MANNDQLRDKLGPLPPENFDQDFSPDKPIRSKADLSPEQRRVLERVLAANPSISEEEALKQLLAHGL